MTPTIRLKTTSPRRWLGNGFGYERASYAIYAGSTYLGQAEPTGFSGWIVTYPDGQQTRHQTMFRMENVRAWARARAEEVSR